MFYELIYTRCRQGMDIARKGQQISGDGYKVYSCTPAIMEEGKVDIQFLVNSAQAKQPYTDPDFMDDAYLFYVPDSGKKFIINFSPIHFDANAKGDYAHRPGNFVNHALLGDFSNFYPYKMFQDDGIWNAKTRGEAYYYENLPASTGLPERGDIADPPGIYKLDEIKAFIADGRQEAYKKAVAFLIAQYGEEPEKRKFLVIKDDSSKNIELWIAAIECAFSPRIACCVPFATRMDKFASTNRYTVKQGIYQPQMNLQDPNHKQRFRAMIVGLDERDKANVSAARPLPNSPFVLLDGKQKQAMFEADTSNRYYQLITKFDAEHVEFCGKFLQAFGVLEPGAKVYELYEIFTVFKNPSLPDTRTLANVLDKFNNYMDKVADKSKASPVNEIYNRVNTDVSRFLQEDFSSALSIINWLLAASQAVGDTGAKQRLTETVCNEFADIIFGQTDNAAKRSYWEHVQRTGFKMDVARFISDRKRINDNLSDLKEFSSADITTFITIYVDSFLLVEGLDPQALRNLLKFGIKTCSCDNDQKSFQEIVSTVSRVKNINIPDSLFTFIKEEKEKDENFCKFVIKYIIDQDNKILASDKSAFSFCEELANEGLGYLAGTVLAMRVDKLNKPSEMESFIKTILRAGFDKEALVDVFKSIDDRIGTLKDNVSSLAELLQTERPGGADGAKCINSAHTFALNLFSGNLKKINLKEVLLGLREQGFPAVTDEKYIDKFVESLLKASIPEEVQEFIPAFMFKSSNEFNSAYLLKLISSASKYKDKWNALFSAASKLKNSQFDNAIVQALDDSKQNEKSLKALGGLLNDVDGRSYYDTLIDRMNNK